MSNFDKNAPSIKLEHSPLNSTYEIYSSSIQTSTRVISLLRFKSEPPTMDFSKLLQKSYIVYGNAQCFKFRQIHAKKTDGQSQGTFTLLESLRAFSLFLRKSQMLIKRLQKTQHVVIPASFRSQYKSEKFQESFSTNNDQIWGGRCKQKRHFPKNPQEIKKNFDNLG